MISPLYDPVLRPFYRPFRKQVIEMLPLEKGSIVLDLACGTGQNFPLLIPRIGDRGKIIGVDTSSGMLRQARKWVKKSELDNVVSLVRMDAATLSPALLKEKTGISHVDFVICTYGFSAMKEKQWELAFHRSFSVLKPGGGYLIHDIYAEKKTVRSRLMSMFTRAHLSRKAWVPLQRQRPDFHMEYIDPSAHIFGGRLYVAYATR